MTSEDYESVSAAARQELKRRKGLDETRRLLYTALLRQRTYKYELAGTLVNALVHHHPDGTSAEEIANQVVYAIENPDTRDGQIATAWLRRRIQQITAELDGEGS